MYTNPIPITTTADSATIQLSYHGTSGVRGHAMSTVAITPYASAAMFTGSPQSPSEYFPDGTQPFSRARNAASTTIWNTM